jgi:hypothetical protein
MAQLIPFPMGRVRRRAVHHVELVAEDENSTPKVLYFSAAFTVAIALVLQLLSM